MAADEYLIEELAQETGMSARTIRYYQQEGLLPEPESRGKFAYYNRDHLNRLRLIRELKALYLPLKEISELFAQLTPAGVEAMLHNLSAVKSNPALLKSMEKQVLAQSDDDTALDYITRLRQAQAASSPPPPAARAVHFAQAAPPPAAPAAPLETWQRIQIAPGVEIHIKEPISKSVRDRLDKLLEFAKKLFS